MYFICYFLYGDIGLVVGVLEILAVVDDLLRAGQSGFEHQLANPQNMVLLDELSLFLGIVH